MKQAITEFWDHPDLHHWISILGVDWTPYDVKLKQQQAIKEHCRYSYRKEPVKCPVCDSLLQRNSLPRHKNTKNVSLI